MAGIYVHIPYCKSKCIYCDFYSVTTSELSMKKWLLDAMVGEVVLRRSYLEDELVSTIYIGGGTPSLLEPFELKFLLDSIRMNYVIADNVEITIEVNPDDVSKELAVGWKNIGVNRLSVGVQSFNDDCLKLLRRRHNAKQSIDCIEIVKSAGFDNISVDLIFGIPFQDVEILENDLLYCVNNNVPHVSAYALTVEENTDLYRMINNEQLPIINEKQIEEHFFAAMDCLCSHGYNHYETSNYCLPSYHSKHNNNYWNASKYLGIGPSAHSYNGTSRHWNCCDIGEYVKGVKISLPNIEIENLGSAELYNEYILCSLRTSIGCDSEYIRTSFGNMYFVHFNNKIKTLLKTGQLSNDEGSRYVLTREGKIFADSISVQLFV